MQSADVTSINAWVDYREENSCSCQPMLFQFQLAAAATATAAADEIHSIRLSYFVRGIGRNVEIRLGDEILMSQLCICRRGIV